MALPKMPAATASTPSSATPPDIPLALVPVWLMTCYFLIVVVGGVVANVLLLVTAAGWRCGRHLVGTQDAQQGGQVCAGVADAEAAGGEAEAEADCRDRDRGWWFLLGQLAAADALSLALLAGGELWALREAGGPWPLPSALCSPFMGLDTMLGAAQNYLLVALALHARAMPAEPVPRPWRSVVRSAIVPSALVWMLASSMAVPRTFLAVTVRPRPSLPLCTLLPTSPATGALEGPLDVTAQELGPGLGFGPGPDGSWWPLHGVDAQGGGPLLSAIVLCVVPTAVLLAAATGLHHGLGHRLRAGCAISATHPIRSSSPDEACPPHQLARREWVCVSSWLAASWLLLSLPRLASAAAHGFLAPESASAFGPAAFRAPPLGSRVLGEPSLLAASMLHYALAAARPVIAALTSPALRRAALPLLPSASTPLVVHHEDRQDEFIQTM